MKTFNSRQSTSAPTSASQYVGFIVISSIAIVAMVLTLMFMHSSPSKHYSPLDSYIKATNERYADSIASRNDAKHFIDSMNHK